MKQITQNRILVALIMAWAFASQSAMAEDVLVQGGIPVRQPARVSDRLIVKLKSSIPAAGFDRVSAVRERPLSSQELGQIAGAAGLGLKEHHMLSSGAHILSVPGTQPRAALEQAIASIARLPNVEYVEEDSIDTIQFVPNDTRYAAGQMWGMMPVNAVAGISSGATGSYGANFQTAWDTSTGAGVVVAVVDGGITPHIDIGGPNALITAGNGSNLVSAGYTFISDCRMIDATADPVHGCAASTPTANATISPFAGALDTGDFITAQDIIDNPYWATLSKTSSSWHGTHVAGTIAAIGNNSLTVIGGAYNAKLLPVRVLGKGGGYMSDIAEGIRWAAGVHPSIPNPNPAKVINLSVGSTGACSQTQQDAINAVVAAGAVMVVAAGNDNTDAATVHPASCANVISVAAVAKDGRRASYSNFSSGVASTITLAAPGGDTAIGTGTYDPGIVSTVNAGSCTTDTSTIPPGQFCTTPVTTLGNSYYNFYVGTSMATPHVSAAVALMLARNPGLTPAQIKSILTASNSVTAFPSFVPGLAVTDCALHQNCGAGILNAALAVQNTPAAPATAKSSSSGGGGGCSILPAGMAPDVSLLLAMLAVAAYGLRRRMVRIDDKS